MIKTILSNFLFVKVKGVMPESRILDFSIVVLIWFGYWCYTFHVSHYLFQPNYFVLHFNDWFSVLSNKFIIFWYSIIILSWIFCLSYGHIYISLGIFLSNPIFSVSLSTVLELLCGEVLETYQRFNCQSNHQLLLLFFELLFLKQF